jgi:hypothetical protein
VGLVVVLGDLRQFPATARPVYQGKVMRAATALLQITTMRLVVAAVEQMPSAATVQVAQVVLAAPV